MSAAPLHPFLLAPGPHALAHRGGRLPGGNSWENSMPAFARAVALGYRFVETDVRATADGALLTFHDATLDRVTDRTGAVARLPYREVARARIGGAEPIPLLEDLLGSWPQLRVNIDVKAPQAVAPLVRVLQRTNALQRVCVASFSDGRLAAVRRALGPAVCTSLGPRGVARLRAVTLGPIPSRLLPQGARCAQVPVRVGLVRVVDRAFVQTAHRHGLLVHVWTVNDATEMDRLLDLGVDGLVSAELDTLRAVLARRGAWPTQGSG